MVRPGDTIRIHVRLDERLGKASYFSGTIKSGERLVANLRFAAMVTGSSE
jgi:hypothetical protein